MNILSMAIKNLRKNFSFYALYLFSVSLVITVFFAFTSFSMNHVMLQKISSDGRVESMCNTISIFLMAFVIFYMSYSNRFFLKRRTTELGIYALLGYRKTSILSLLTLENILILCIAFIVGILAGAVTHKGIVIGITAFLHLSVDYSLIPLFNINAIGKTAAFLLLAALALCLSNGRLLFTTSLIEWIRLETKAEKNMKFYCIPALFGLVMILSGYGLALNITKGRHSLWFTIGFYPIGMVTAILIAIGSVLFIASFLPYVIHKSKHNKKNFYTASCIITIPNFIYRIRSHAKTLIMLTLLSAATLSVTSITALTIYYPIAATSRIAPSELEFKVENEKQIAAAKQIVRQYASNSEVTYTLTNIYKVTSSAKQLPAEYSLGTSIDKEGNTQVLRKAVFECISYANYQSLLQAQGKYHVLDNLPIISDEECILIKYQPNADKHSEIGNVYPLSICGKEIPLTVKEVSLDNPISFANSIATLIISDTVYEQLQKEEKPLACILSINGTVLKNKEALYTNLSDILEQSPYLQGQSHRIHELFSLNSSTFLLIGFLVVLFFIATGSIMYFNNISSVLDTKADYDILMKMGYTLKHIRKIIKKQTAAFFCIPFLLGLADCIFAILVYKTALMQDLLGNTWTQYIPAILAIFIVGLIYLIYYLLTFRTCCKILSKQ